MSEAIIKATAETAQAHRLSGRILFDYGLPAAGIIIRLYNRGFGGVDVLLGEATTSDNGTYSISYELGGHGPNLDVRAVTASDGKTEVSLAETLYNAGPDEVMNLVAPASVKPLASEYDRLTADLKTQIGKSKLGDASEHGDRRDLTLLHKATNWDARLIALLVTASKLSQETMFTTNGITEETVYGLLRAGLPADQVSLVATGTQIIKSALDRVQAAGIIGLAPDQISAMTANFEKLAGTKPPVAETVELPASKPSQGFPQNGNGFLPSFAGKLEVPVKTFLTNAAQLSFELGQTPIGSFIAHNDKGKLFKGIKSEEIDATVDSVKRLHRLYQITPTDGAMTALERLGFSSAQDVTALTSEEFVDQFGGEFHDGDKTASRQIAELVHRKAQQVTAVAQNVLAAVRQLDSAPTIFALSAPAAVRDEAKAELIKHYPALETLFGSLDYCECEHCRSVLSPAAYFVDLLQFLNPKTGPTPYDKLIARRPDLAHLPLTCENTNTELPYIDVVNEILEYYVAHDHKLEAGAARDTGKTATPELLAEPQYIEPAAYDKLNSANYPLTLPFDLWLETVRRFLDYFETPLAKLLDTFRKTEPLFTTKKDDPDYYRAAIFAEQLGISPSEYSIFTKAYTSTTWFELYGYKNENGQPAGEFEAKVISELESAKHLSRKLGITYKELIQVIGTDLINLELTGDLSGCNFDIAKVSYAKGVKIDAVALLKINLFVRLWKKLGWTIEETDRALMVFLPGGAASLTLDKSGEAMQTALVYLAHLKELDTRVKLGKGSRLKLLTLWSNLATTGKNPLYAQLFLTRSMLQSDNVFAAGSDGRFLSPVTPANKINAHLFALQGAFSLTADEIARILNDAGKNITDADLLLENVSLLYRYALLAQGLRLSIDDLITLKTLSGLDPFMPLASQPLSQITSAEQVKEDHPFSQTLRFVETVERVKASGFQIDELDYLVRHQFDPEGKHRENKNDVLALVRSLTTGLGRVSVEQSLPADQSAITYDLLREKLTLLLTTEVVDRFMGFWKDTVEFSEAKTNVSPDQKLAPSIYEVNGLRVAYDGVRRIQRLTHTGVLTEEKKTRIRDKVSAPDDSAPQATKDAYENFKSLLDQIAASSQPQGKAFVDQYFENLLSQPERDAIFSATDIATRRIDLLNAILPLIRTRLSRRLVVDLVTATLGDAALTESLLMDTALLADPSQTGSPEKPLLDAFMTSGVTAKFYTSNDLTGTPALKIVADPGTSDSSGNASIPAGTESAQFESYLEVPTSGAYRFYAAITRKDVEVKFSIGDQVVPLFTAKAATDNDEISQSIELKAGVPYHYVLEVRKLGGGHISLSIESENLKRGSLSRLIQHQSDSFDRAGRALVLLRKIFNLIEGFKLNEREIRYLRSHAGDFDDLKLSDLPTTTSVSSSVSSKLFRQFLRLADYALLKREIGIVGDELIGVFELAQQGNADVVCQRVAEITRHASSTVRTMADYFGFTKDSAAIRKFADERGLFRLWAGLRLVERLRVPVEEAINCTSIVSPTATPNDRFKTARNIRNALKARYDGETWLRIAQPISDTLRQRRRDALTAYIMDQLGHHRLEELFEHFLIDPGMEPIVTTSRLRLAISSVQLFIQRCLLSLEQAVKPSEINVGRWQWMKHYRVWEANRKIFLYPENFLEPEFRDDKTHLFQELESSLLQGDVSNELAEDAFSTYLKKLEEFARLEIVSVHMEEKSDPASNVVHVLGRTSGQPHQYFYRRNAHRMWSPWEPVNVEIEGDHIALAIWRDRLHLFWATFLDRPVSQPPGTQTFKAMADRNVADLNPSHLIDVQLNWSEYFQGAWTPRKATEFTGSIPQDIFDSSPVSIYVHPDFDSTEESALRIVITNDLHISDKRRFSVSFRLTRLNSRFETSADKSERWTFFAPQGDGQEAFVIGLYETVSTQDGKYRSTSFPPKTKLILNKGHRPVCIRCNNLISVPLFKEGDAKAAGQWYHLIADPMVLRAPFFYQDERDVFYVEPTLSETTTTRQAEPVFAPVAPRLNGDASLSTRLEALTVTAQVPIAPSNLSPLTHSLASFKLLPRRDWVVDSVKLVTYQEQLIGEGGGLTQSEWSTLSKGEEIKS